MEAEKVGDEEDIVVQRVCMPNGQVYMDDVNPGVVLPADLVLEAMGEELKYMTKRRIWVPRSIQECWEKTGKLPVSVKWVKTNKLYPEGVDVRCRLVARDFKAGDKHRDDLFAEAPPLEAKRTLISRAATQRRDGRWRSLMFIGAKKAHLNPKCEDDVYNQLPPEVPTEKGMCGKLVHWLYGFGPAAAAWERYYADKFEEKGFQRGLTCGMVLYHPELDVSMAVHGDDFTLCGL